MRPGVMVKTAQSPDPRASSRPTLGLLRLAALRLPRARTPDQLRETLAPRALERGDARPQRPALLTSKRSTG